MPLHSSVRRSFRTVRDLVSISADFYIAMAAGLLLLPLPWISAWLFSALFHELCHYIALRICGYTVSGIRISLKGVFMETEALSAANEAICAYAGPIGALVLLLLARRFPRVAVCTIVQSLYNLLPIFPLDGGRGLGCFLRKLLGDARGKQAFMIVERVVLFVLLFLALFAYVKLGLGLLPALAVIFIIVKNKKINIPCKNSRKGLQ